MTVRFFFTFVILLQAITLYFLFFQLLMAAFQQVSYIPKMNIYKSHFLPEDFFVDTTLEDRSADQRQNLKKGASGMHFKVGQISDCSSMDHCGLKQMN